MRAYLAALRDRAHYAAMAVLAISLCYCVYLIFLGGGKNELQERTGAVSILIADFDNTTGDSLFTDTLEQAMQVGLEGAPFISAYSRDSAEVVASAMQDAGDVLDIDTARRVSLQEGINVVLTGGINEDQGKFSLYVRAINAQGGEVLASAEADVIDRPDILNTIGVLANEIRVELGDQTLGAEDTEVTESFSAGNLEAAQAYGHAQSLQYRGRYAEAMEYYRRAIEHDPDLGRAHSGLALSAFSLGQTDVSDHHWDRALATLDTMSERERLRTLGLYYSIVQRDFEKSIETYETLVERYPADDTAHNGLAVQYFFTLDFDRALEHGGHLLEIYPNNVMGRSNYALYAMYASQFDRAVDAAHRVRELDENYFKAWLPIAMHALADRDINGAAAAYEAMADAGERGTLTSMLGLADVSIFAGDTAAAQEHLQAGIDLATETGSQYFRSTFLVARAEAEFLDGNISAALATMDEAMATASGLPQQVPAALLFIKAGARDRAAAIGERLLIEPQSQSRAYGNMIAGLLALESGDSVTAIDAMYSGIEIADLWMLRLQLGCVYLEAGYPAEALEELNEASARIGEATSVFLDDLPTWRYTAELSGLLDQAKRETAALAMYRRRSADERLSSANTSH